MRVVVNRCYGGFSLSRAGVLRARELGAVWATPEADCVLPGEKYSDGSSPMHDFDSYYPRAVDRHDSILVAVVEEFGKSASGRLADLRIVEIPDGVEYEIEEYDGMESVHETHRSWR